MPTKNSLSNVQDFSQSLSFGHGCSQWKEQHKAWISLVLVSAAIVVYILYQTYWHPLAKFPGPKSARYLPSWRNTRYWRGSWHEDILQVHRKYGCAVRIAPNEISIVDAKAVKQLYGHGTKSVKSQWYATWDPVMPGAVGFFSSREPKEHAFHRKRVTSAYAMSAILKYEEFIQDSLGNLLEKFRIYSEAGKSVNMSVWANAFAFDVVGQLGFGESFGQVETESDTMNLRKTVFNIFRISAGMGHYYLGFGGHYWGQSKIFTNSFAARLAQMLGQKNNNADFIKWGTGRLKQRMAAEEIGEVGRPDMLSHFLKITRPDGSPAEFNEVLSEVFNLVGAGADTTSIAMRTCVHAICLRPEVYNKLQDEIDAFYADNKLTTGITYLETQKLPYLVAVCKEAMRLLPSIVFQLLRYVPKGGMYVDGKYIPTGYEVGISPLAQNRDKNIWGPDADDFKPERWLESEDRTRFLDSCNLTFGGSGPRMCVGKNIALVEVHKFVAQLFHHFDVDVVNSNRPWRITSFWFAYQHDFHCKLIQRKQFPLPKYASSSGDT